jgi:predicted aminopeptidase
VRPAQGLAAALAIALSAPGCWSLKYLAQQGVGELKLLHARRKIVDVLADPTVDAHTKERLRLAVAARDFGVEQLGLRGGDAYTRYLETHGQPVAWNLSAAPKDRLLPHLHRFPITGAVPYLGFFRERDARREEARLEALGYDTYVRAVAGYSTLGLTSDPIYSSMLEGDEARVVEVTLHEMLHGTLYLAGHTEWNESLATFVGLRGAALFFSQRSNSAAARVLAEAEKRDRRAQEFAAFLEPILHELETLYASPRPRDEKLRLREQVFARAHDEYLRRFPLKPGAPPPPFVAQPLNNAVLLSFAAYHRSTPEHQRLFEKVHRDLRSFIALYKRAVENHQNDAIEWLRQK